MPASDARPIPAQRSALAHHLIASLNTRAADWAETGGADIPICHSFDVRRSVFAVDPISWFRRARDQFNPRHPWRTNPWVWVISFRVAPTGPTP
jgi:hypothetical protein